MNINFLALILAALSTLVVGLFGITQKFLNYLDERSRIKRRRHERRQHG